MGLGWTDDETLMLQLRWYSSDGLMFNLYIGEIRCGYVHETSDKMWLAQGIGSFICGAKYDTAERACDVLKDSVCFQVETVSGFNPTIKT